MMSSPKSTRMWQPGLIRTAVIGAGLFIASTTSASPPLFHEQLRLDPNEWAFFSGCQASASGDYCMFFDVAPGFLYYNLDTFNASEFISRYFFCPVDQDAFEVKQNTLAIRLLTTVNAGDCDQYTWEWNEATQEWESGIGLEGSLAFDITLRDPESFSSDISNGVETYLGDSMRFECSKNRGSDYRDVVGGVNGLAIPIAGSEGAYNVLNVAGHEQCNIGSTIR